MQERQINILDLIWHILLRWRMLIVSMLLGGILMGGFSYVSSYQDVITKKETMQEQEKNPAVVKEKLEEVLTDGAINDVLNTIKYEQRYDDCIVYQEETFALNVDPFNVAKADVIFLVQTDDIEKTYNVQKVYGSILKSADLYNYIEEKCSLDYSASQLISIDESIYDDSNGCDTLKVNIVYSNEEKCQEIVSGIIEYIAMKQVELVEILGEHSLNVIMQSSMVVADGEYLTLQTEYEHKLVQYSNTVTTLKSSFSEEQKSYYNCILEKDEVENVSDEVDVAPAKASINVKYVVIGMLLMAVIYVCYIAIKYILNNKLRPSESLADLYSIHQLGFIPLEQKKRNKLGIIDEWILSLKNRNKRKFNSEEAVSMAVTALKIALRKSSENEVFLVGCDIKKQTVDVCEEIGSILGKEGITVNILDNILYDAESMSKLENAHCVVLVEKADSTLYDEIEKEIEILERQDIIILGGIVVE